METYGYNHPGSDQNPNFNSPNYRSQQKIPAALLGILLAPFAANKFYLGYTKEAIIQIILNIVTCGVATIIPLIEGIIYLTMSDGLFDQTYIQQKKGWF